MEEPIADPRPSANPLEMESMRARVETALFGRGAPARFGRYHIIEPIAGGGMGVVYAAYDPDLDRRVALKVLHPQRTHDERAQTRLITEARALARLDHPNVVKVHDVVTHDGIVVIVMELVVGQDLGAWAQQRRTWRDAVRVYQQAAQGLVAAHGVGVVHRDFKPSNAIIGADGRVRVLDFGLARFGEPTDPSHSPASVPVSDLTHTGDVLGTIAYASPEQLRGESTTAATDQFSWCVSLHQAIEGVAPFAGSAIEARLTTIDARELRLGESGHAVPAWLRALLARGMSPRARDRFPDMAALLAELSRTRGIRRFRTPLLVLGTLGVGTVASSLAMQSDSIEECDGGRSSIDETWNAQIKGSIVHSLDAIGSPYALEVRDRIVAGLDRFATEWSASHLAACRDHRKGTTSASLLDRRMLCLDERLSDLRAATTVVQRTDTATLTNAMDIVARMPPVSRCADLQRLRADVEPPEGDILREQVRQVRAKIANAEALARAGRSEAARTAAADAVAAGRQTQYEPVKVEAALAHSRVLMGMGELPAAASSLTLARSSALQHSMMPAAVEAGARLVYVENMALASKPNIERDAAFLEPLSKLRGAAELARPLLLNNLGAAYLATGDRGRAHTYFQAARDAMASVPAPDLELIVIDRNLAMLTPDDRTRREISAAVVQRLRESLGPTHPSTLEAMAAAAEYEVDPQAAYDLARTVTEAYRTVHPTLVHNAMFTHAWRAFLASELDDDQRAQADYRVAIAEIERASNPDLAPLRALMVGELAVLDGELARAEQSFKQVLAFRDGATAWWERLDVLRAEVGLGAVAIARNDGRTATRHLETAISGLPSITAFSEVVLPRRLKARAEKLLAGTLRAADSARADRLEQDARAFYLHAPNGYSHTIKALSK